MSGREMREQTKKKYARLPEVQEKKLQLKAEQERRTNRLMSHVFAKVLNLTIELVHLCLDQEITVPILLFVFFRNLDKVF